jgi:hypothetical protein
MIRATLLCLVAAAAMGVCAAGTPAAPSGSAKENRALALKNPGFENVPRASERCPEGWECRMHSNAESFVFRVEAPEGAGGKQALCIERVLHEPWALVTQSMQGGALRGATLRFSVAVRVESADGAGAGAWAVVHGPFGTLAHEERLLKATKGWERVSVDFPVGPAAQMVEVGATLQGGGRICIDDARLEARAP